MARNGHEGGDHDDSGQRRCGNQVQPTHELPPPQGNRRGRIVLESSVYQKP
jgi:hypothetical protein